MTKEHFYWIFQLVGWTACCLFELMLYSYAFEFQSLLIVNALITLSLGIIITHVYRLFIKKLGWLKLPLERLIPRMLGSIALMAILMTSLCIPVDYYTAPGMFGIIENASLMQMFFFATGWGRYFLLWSLLYHLFQYYQRSKTIMVIHRPPVV